MVDPAGAEPAPKSYDALARDLQALRFAAGDIPYAEIVRRIGEHRTLNGAPGGSARPARTTVYDAFRPGRARVNPSLVGDIARALGASEEEVAGWQRRCLDVRRQAEQAASHPDGQPPAAPATPPGVQPGPAGSPQRPLVLPALILMVVCLATNVLGMAMVPWLGLPLFLDMVGTAMAALVLGPWWGVLVGVSSNLIGVAITGESALAFGLVQIVGALVWGYGAKRFGHDRSIFRFFMLNAVVAFACTLVSTAILVLLYDGSTGHASEFTMQTILGRGGPLSAAVFSSNLLYSLVDKCLAGFIVLAVLGAVGAWFTVPFQASLVRHKPHSR